MEFQENLFTEFDSQLTQVSSLKWLPWIGKHYNNTKIVVLGESQSEDGDEWQEDNIDATRTLIGKRFSENTGKIYTNAEKVLLSMDKPSKEQGNFLWKSVTYCNLVQRLMMSRDYRPSSTDFDNGWDVFFSLVDILKPNTCIVLGQASNGRLGYYLNNNDTGWERNVHEFYETEKIINLSKDGHKLKLIFINHPSGSFGFEYERWAKLISDNEPDLQKLLTQ